MDKVLIMNELPYAERHAGFIKDYNDLAVKWGLTIASELRIIEYTPPITKTPGVDIPLEEIE